MVDKKANVKTLMNIFFVVVLVSVLAIFVFAGPVPFSFSASVVSSGNYTGNSLLINFTTDLNASNVSQAAVDLNATCFYNSSGGDIYENYTGTTFIDDDVGRLGEVMSNATEITSSLNTTFTSSVDISGLDDSYAYNISCKIDNGTSQNWTSVTNVTIDRTPPEVNFSSSASVSADGNYSASDITGDLNINVSVADAMERAKRLLVLGDRFGNDTYVYINISNWSNHQVNLTRAINLSAVTTFYNMTIDMSNSAAYPDGRYNITILANDTMIDTLSDAGNMNDSEYIQIILDRLIPTKPVLTRGTGTTTTQNVITISVTDATSGVDLCTVRSGSSTGFVTDSTTITGRGTNTQTLTHTGLSCGNSYSYIVTCIDHVRYSSLASINKPFSTRSCSDSGGPGGDTTVSSTVETNVLDTISPDIEATLSGFEEDMGIEEIKISVTEVANNVQVVVTKFDTEPAEITVSKSGQVHKYLQITSQNLATKLERAILTIKVQKNWLLNSDIDKANIAMFKLDEDAGVWEELLTVYKSEDDDYYYYDVEVDSFSYFAIAEKGIEDEGEDEEPVAGNLLWLWITIGVVVVALIIGGGVAAKKRK